jgi:ribosomal protein L32
MRGFLARLARRMDQTEACMQCGHPKYTGQACPGCGAR